MGTPARIEIFPYAGTTVYREQSSLTNQQKLVPDIQALLVSYIDTRVHKKVIIRSVEAGTSLKILEMQMQRYEAYMVNKEWEFAEEVLKPQGYEVVSGSTGYFKELKELMNDKESSLVP